MYKYKESSDLFKKKLQHEFQALNTYLSSFKKESDAKIYIVYPNKKV